MNFLVHAREGNSYTTTQGKVVTISETFTKISAPQTQREALNYIGIQFIGDRLILNFLETGNPYADVEGDRTKLGEKISDTVFVELALKQKFRYIGITIKTKTIPNTWRWQQNNDSIQ